MISAWSDRRMSLMQPKWFQRPDVAVGHVVWAVGETVVGGTVQAIDDDGHYTVAIDGGGTMASVCRQNICLKWQVGASVRVPAMAAPGGGSSLRAPEGGVRAVGMGAAAAQAGEDQRVRSNGVEREEVAGVEALTMVRRKRKCGSWKRWTEVASTTQLFCLGEELRVGAAETERYRAVSRRMIGSSYLRASTSCWSISSHRSAVSREKLSNRRAS